ncbi:MAG: hypothetical protein KY397_03730 [Gemmatimonadetes bacterium]|nr:hypothetical protein [Gemmatimonadota bacterium]
MTRLWPLFEAPAVWLLALDALAILAVWVVARAGRAERWGGVVLRVLAALGLVIPGFTVFDWYRDLAEAREWARELPIRTESIMERFAVSSVALVSLGFLILVAGIYLARRLPESRSPSDGEST